MNDLALSDETAISPADIFVDGESITETDLESTCNKIIQRLNETSDTSEIEQAVTNLNGVEKFATRAKSKLIYAWSQWYKSVNKLDDFPKWFTQKIRPHLQVMGTPSFVLQDPHFTFFSLGCLSKDKGSTICSTICVSIIGELI